MALKYLEEYLFGEKVLGFGRDRTVSSLQKEETEKIRSLSKKERALRFNGFVITDEQGNIIFEDRKRYAQHFFSIICYRLCKSNV